MTSLAGAGYQAVQYVMNHAEQFQSDGRDRAYQYIDENNKFDWTEDQFKELKVGTLTLGGGSWMLTVRRLMPSIVMLTRKINQIC